LITTMKKEVERQYRNVAINDCNLQGK